MLLQLLSLSSLIFAQQNFSIHRVDQNNHLAVVQTGQLISEVGVKAGDEFKIQTPDGDCYTPVSEVIDGFFYVNTQQCRDSDVQKGITLVSTTTTRVIPQEPVTITRSAPSHFPGDDSFSTTSEISNSPFYNDYIADKLSVYMGYHAGNTLDGQLPVGGQNSITELSGAHTIGFGAEYEVAKMPYNLSAVGGISYNLPRSYGRYTLNTSTGPAQKFSEGANPELRLWSFYGNVRYRFLKDAYAYMGINRLVASMSNLPGKTSGDFGFHLGARYYPASRIFVDTAINFYNLNYEFQGVTKDVSLTEVEVKGGYTF
jgi:hypothetical protein